MKISKRQLKNIILEVIDSSTVDGGQFPWPSDKPWWANSAEAYGEWDANDNIVYDLVQKHNELSAKFEDMAESVIPKGEVTPGELEIEKERRFSRLRKNKDTAVQVSDEVEQPQEVDSAVAQYRQLSNTSDLSYSNQAMFANIADRFFIVQELKRFKEPQGQEFGRELMGDIELLVDVNSADGRSRKGIVLAKLQDHYSAQIDLIEDFNEYSDLPSATVKAGGVKGMTAKAYVDGDLPEDTVWTLKNDKKFAYRKNKDTSLGWEYALQQDIKDGKFKFKPLSGGAGKLNQALSNNTLEANPMYTEKIRGNSNMAESLSFDRFQKLAGLLKS